MQTVVFANGSRRRKLDVSQAVFEGDTERAHSEANEQQSDKSKHNLQKVIILNPFGGQKSEMFDRRCSKSFSKMCFPPQPGSTFLQTIGKKNDVMQRCMQNAFCNLHFRCKFAPMSVQHSFFAFRSASAERNENHKNRPADRFGAAGRNARGRWGRYEEV